MSSETLAKPDLTNAIDLRLRLLGCPPFRSANEKEAAALVAPLLARQIESSRLLSSYLCPADWRIQRFLDEYLYETNIQPRLPSNTFVLDLPGLARALSLPPDRDEFVSDILRSYRLHNGILHNPVNDRRTTAGVFHVAEGGLPIPHDKLSTPKLAFARLLHAALHPPQELMRLPFTSSQQDEAHCFVSLLLRPLVCPEVPGQMAQRSMEIRFFAPGTLVSNLNFVENIFGNGGDPFLPENDAGLDPEHWTGHSGCVILAPHLTKLTKQELGLPHYEEATERQRRDGMCWRRPDELYNNGSAFKVCARDASGVVVTIIADNYFGYCKKEVKTQISFAANLGGLAEEEHAGGALVCPSFDMGEEYTIEPQGYTIEEMAERFPTVMDPQPAGHAIDRTYPDIIYVPDAVHFDLRQGRVSWTDAKGVAQSIKLLANHTYVCPNGYKVRAEKPPGGRAWRLVGTQAEPTFCHKPSTVSGGGKSEISKSIGDAIIQGPVVVGNFDEDFKTVASLLDRDYSSRFSDPAANGKDHRNILSKERSLGSVIKLLTPSESDYSPEYNRWLNSIPQHIKELVFVLKRFYKPAWGDSWKEQFSVDFLDGKPGNELKFRGRKLVSNYLRVGFAEDGSWRVFGLRKDFHPAEKIQTEDDISASAVAPTRLLKGLSAQESRGSVKFVINAESMLFQRPDDAIHRGYDKQAEFDISSTDCFLSNFEPLTQARAQELLEDVVGFSAFSQPMQDLIRKAATSESPAYFVSSAHPRIVDGAPSKNPRYLQIRPDTQMPREVYLTRMGARMQRRLPIGSPVLHPVDVTVPGRRNNPREGKIRPLAVFGPLHYLETPELFLEYICSLTGKSPSTTGAGSEGALTKGPFNGLLPIIDLNNALVAHLLTEENVFLSAAGWVGPKLKVNHDVSLLVPEVFCRMSIAQRQPEALIAGGFLERCRDFEHAGKQVLGSRLGWRITAAFVRAYFGRVFNNPHAVFTEEMLRPELQDMESFVDGMDNIISTQRTVAESYFQDGSIDLACPPLKALLHIMRDGHHEGRDLSHPEIRALFKRDTVLGSDWYQARLAAQQEHERKFWHARATYIELFLKKDVGREITQRLTLELRRERAWDHYHNAKAPEYLERIRGTIGRQPLNT